MEDMMSAASYCQPVKRYTIPRKERRPSEGCQYPVSSNSREAKEIENDVRRLAWDALNLDRTVRVLRTCKIDNPRLEREFHEKRSELRADGRLPKEVTEQLAFRAETDFSKVSDICVNGLRCGGKDGCLGDANMGVSVWRCPDVCVGSVDWPGSGSVFLIVFKIVKGRVKQMTCNPEGPSLEPTPNYDCHISRNTPSPSITDCNALMTDTQYYLYEYDDDGLPCERPRQCLPFAVIYLEKAQDASRTSALPTLEKAVNLLNPVKAPEGGNVPVFEGNGGNIAWRGLVTNKQKSLGWAILMAAHKLGLSFWRSYFDVTQKISLRSLESLLPGDIITAWKEPLVYRGHVFSLCIMKTPGQACESFIKFTKDLSTKAKSAGVVSIDTSTTIFLVPSSTMAVRLGLCDTEEPWRMFCVICRRQKTPGWRGERVSASTYPMNLSSPTDSSEQSVEGNDTASFSPKLLDFQSTHRSPIFSAAEMYNRKPKPIFNRSQSHNSALPLKRVILKEHLVKQVTAGGKENYPKEAKSTKGLTGQKGSVDLLPKDDVAEPCKTACERRSSWPIRSNSPVLIPFLELVSCPKASSPSDVTPVITVGCSPPVHCGTEDTFTSVKDHEAISEIDSADPVKIGGNSPIAADARSNVGLASTSHEKENKPEETSHSPVVAKELTTTTTEGITLSSRSVVMTSKVGVVDSNRVHTADVIDARSTEIALQPSQLNFTSGLSPRPGSSAVSIPSSSSSPVQPAGEVKTLQEQRRFLLSPCCSSSTDRTIGAQSRLTSVAFAGHDNSPVINELNYSREIKSTVDNSYVEAKQKRLQKEEMASRSSTCSGESSSVTNETRDTQVKRLAKGDISCITPSQRKLKEGRSDLDTSSSCKRKKLVTNEQSHTRAKRKLDEGTSSMLTMHKKLQKARGESSISTSRNWKTLPVSDGASDKPEKQRSEKCFSYMETNQKKLQNASGESSISTSRNWKTLPVSDEASDKPEKQRSEKCFSYMETNQKKLQNARGESSTSATRNCSSLPVLDETSDKPEKQRSEKCFSYMETNQKKLQNARGKSSTSDSKTWSSLTVSDETSGKAEKQRSEKCSSYMETNQRKLQNAKGKSSTSSSGNASPLQTKHATSHKPEKRRSEGCTFYMNTSQRILEKATVVTSISTAGGEALSVSNATCNTHDNILSEGNACNNQQKLQKERKESLTSDERKSPVTKWLSDKQEESKSEDGSSYSKSSPGNLQQSQGTLSVGDESLRCTGESSQRQGKLPSKVPISETIISQETRSESTASAFREAIPRITNEPSLVPEKMSTAGRTSFMATNQLHKARNVSASNPPIAACQSNLNREEDSSEMEIVHDEREVVRGESSLEVRQDTSALSGKKSDRKVDAVTCAVKGDNNALESGETSLKGSPFAPVPVSSQEGRLMPDVSVGLPQKVNMAHSSEGEQKVGGPSGNASIDRPSNAGGNKKTCTKSGPHVIPMKKWQLYKNAFRKVFVNRLPVFSTGSKVLADEANVKTGCFDFEEGTRKPKQISSEIMRDSRNEDTNKPKQMSVEQPQESCERNTNKLKQMTSETPKKSCKEDTEKSKNMTPETLKESGKDNVVKSTSHVTEPAEGLSQTMVSSTANLKNDYVKITIDARTTSFHSTADNMKKHEKSERLNDELSLVLPVRKPRASESTASDGSLIRHSVFDITDHVTPRTAVHSSGHDKPSCFLDSGSEEPRIVKNTVSQKPSDESSKPPIIPEVPPICGGSVTMHSPSIVTPNMASSVQNLDDGTPRVVTNASTGKLDTSNHPLNKRVVDGEVSSNEKSSPNRLNSVSENADSLNDKTSACHSERRLEEEMSTLEETGTVETVSANKQVDIGGGGSLNHCLEGGKRMAGDQGAGAKAAGNSLGSKGRVTEKIVIDLTISDSTLAAEKLSECTSELVDGNSTHSADIVSAASCGKDTVKRSEKGPPSSKVNALLKKTESTRTTSSISWERLHVFKEYTSHRYGRPENEQNRKRHIEHDDSWRNGKEQFKGSMRHSQSNHNKYYDHTYGYYDYDYDYNNNNNNVNNMHEVQLWRKRDFPEGTNPRMHAKRFRLEEGQRETDVNLRMDSWWREGCHSPRDRQFASRRVTERRPAACSSRAPAHLRQDRYEHDQQHQSASRRLPSLLDFRPPQLPLLRPGGPLYVPSLRPACRPLMRREPVTAVTWSVRRQKFVRGSLS